MKQAPALRAGVSIPVLTVLAALWIAPPAHAYIDAGTASIVFQFVVASIAASLLFLRMWWANAKSFVARLLGRESADSSSAPSEDSPSLDD